MYINLTTIYLFFTFLLQSNHSSGFLKCKYKHKNVFYDDLYASYEGINSYHYRKFTYPLTRIMYFFQFSYMYLHIPYESAKKAF